MPGRYFVPVLSGGVMVAQESLELFVMVRIHAGQPVLMRERKMGSNPAQPAHRIRPHPQRFWLSVSKKQP